MLPTTNQLRTLIGQVLDDSDEQGHAVEELRTELATVRDSYDDLIAFAGRLGNIPMRDGWPYVEPDDLMSIEGEWNAPSVSFAVDDAAARVRAAFTARVCGCMLGKPFEVFVSLDEIRRALDAHGEWPLRTYPSEAVLRSLPSLQGQWRELHRDGITHVAPDDDINYTILAMLALERHGANVTHDDLRTLWLYNLPVLATFGPERTFLARSAVASTTGEDPDPLGVLNPGAELCGALIRADAYGYACVGRPDAAARLAFVDASMTHRRTGVYGAMFVAAAIAVAPALDDTLDVARAALGYVPKRSRFHERTSECLAIVEGASDWLGGYERVHERFAEYGFCRIYQEIGTLINTLRFATDTGDGICLQVTQGNDTDSFGATAGSILGAFFGPGSLEERWVTPFNDDVRTALAMFHERSLAAIAERMAALPARLADELESR